MLLTPKELAFEACNIGEKKVNNKITITFISAILAGMYIALGYYGFLIVNNDLLSTILGKLFGAMVFPVGIVLVIITGCELFTGNCLITLGYFAKRYKFASVLRNWLIVWVGNFVGALLFGAILYFSRSADNKQMIEMINKISLQKVNLTFLESLMRGILCNILVSLAVYLSFASKTVSGKIIASILPVFLFVLSGYEHSVANMFILPFSVFLGNNISLGLILKNLIPVTLGNVIGGGVIIPLAYYFVYVKENK